MSASRDLVVNPFAAAAFNLAAPAATAYVMKLFGIANDEMDASPAVGNDDKLYGNRMRQYREIFAR